MEENTEKSKKSNKSNKNWWIIILAVGVILLIVFVFWLLMKGDVKTTGEYPDDVSPQSLECINNSTSYNFFRYNNPSDAEIKITAIFAKSRIDSISLIYRAAYNDKETVKLMSNDHEGSMNISFQEKDMKPYSLGATYSQDDKTAQMALYAKASELNDQTIKYFMLDSVPENLTGYKRGYLAQGFTCKIKR